MARIYSAMQVMSVLEAEWWHRHSDLSKKERRTAAKACIAELKAFHCQVHLCLFP